MNWLREMVKVARTLRISDGGGSSSWDGYRCKETVKRHGHTCQVDKDVAHWQHTCKTCGFRWAT